MLAEYTWQYLIKTGGRQTRSVEFVVLHNNDYTKERKEILRKETER